MKDSEKSVIAEEIISSSENSSKKKFAFPSKITLKKGVMTKIVVGIIAALVLIPVVDWVIQTSITSQYAAFYKDSDISRTEYVKELEMRYGEQVVSAMLQKAAITQAAKDRGITVSEDEITKAINEIKVSNGITTEEEFKTALEQNGLTEAGLRADTKIAAMLDKLLEGAIKEPTDKDAEAYFKDNATLFTGKKFADVKVQILETLKQDNITTQREEWIGQALKGYNPKNLFVSKTSRGYKLFKSIDLVQRLFSADPAK